MGVSKVFISAYIAGNLGDDLFIDVLCNRYPNVKFYIIGSNKYKHYFAHLNNLKYISLNHYLWKIINYFSLSHFLSHFLISLFVDTNVLITGSLLEENENYKKNILKKKIDTYLFKKVFYLSCSMGKYKTNGFLEECSKLFERVNDICFRDSYSYNLFSNMENIRYHPDVVYQLDYKHQAQENYIIISIIDLSFRDDLKTLEEEYISKIIEVISKIVEKEYDVLLMGFCENEMDHIGIQKVLNKLPENLKSNIMVHMHKNINESIEIFAKSKGVIATRFHSFILAYIMNKPMYNIYYGMKTKNAINDLSTQPPVIDLKDINSLDTDSVIQSLDMNVKYDETPVKASQNQFKALDRVLLK